MTIIEAINRSDNLKFNGFAQADKVAWLSTLDMKIQKEIIERHEGGEEGFEGYSAETPLTTELLVKAPYDELYLRWLEAQADYANGEMGRYNNSITMFLTAYGEFERWYNRTHMPKTAELKLF